MLIRRRYNVIFRRQPEGVPAGLVREGEGHREEGVQGAPQARRPVGAGRQGAVHQERQGPQDLRRRILPRQGTCCYPSLELALKRFIFFLNIAY